MRNLADNLEHLIAISADYRRDRWAETLRPMPYPVPGRDGATPTSFILHYCLSPDVETETES